MQIEPPVEISTEHKTLMANCKNCSYQKKGYSGLKKKMYSLTKKIVCQSILLQIDKNPCLEKKSIIDKKPISTKLSIQI